VCISVCELHGWKARPGPKVKVIDAILMSTELDLLEIRMNELDHVVDRFYIVESNATFTGLPKETFFALNRARFSKFEKKISYRL
jgi:beta-1,4-mannosyl-glycoprotein beta-1,4-N-acetylglucosaminyltransferase